MHGIFSFPSYIYTTSSLYADPSLTIDNLKEVFESIPGSQWDDAGRRLRVPESKRKEIENTYQSNSQRREEIVVSYVNEHPCPSWAHVARVLSGMEHLDLVKELTEKYISSEGVEIQVLYMHASTLACGKTSNT